MTEPAKRTLLTDLSPRIVVIGVGGAGCNAVNNMIATKLDGVEFVVANTDAQSLAMSSAQNQIQLGVELTEGLGAGARPEVGEAAAREAEAQIREQIKGAHMVFIAAGMGGGTGTGAAAVIAEIARDMEILTVAIVSKPFQFEGARRMRIADAGIDELERFVDTLIVIPNQNLFRIANERTTFAEAFVLADQVLYSGIACIVDLIVKEGLINLDFADVRAVMTGMGTAMMGTGEAEGEGRADLAAEEAISNPLLDSVSLAGAQGLLVSIVGDADMTLFEVDAAASRVRQEVAADANIIVGATFDDTLENKIRVSIVASGMPSHRVQGGGNTASPAVATGAPVSPPPLDSSTAQRPMDESEAREFARALDEAMGGRGETNQPQDAHANVSPVAPEPDAGSSFWESSNGALVREGFTQGQDTAAAPPRQDASRSAEGLPPHRAAGGHYDPAAPHPMPVATPRMPDLSDFPEQAQKEYFAKRDAALRSLEGTGSGGSQLSADDDATERPGKPGLFRRLAKMASGDSADSPELAAIGGATRDDIKAKPQSSPSTNSFHDDEGNENATVIQSEYTADDELQRAETQRKNGTGGNR